MVSKWEEVGRTRGRRGEGRGERGKVRRRKDEG